jgi:hypothetical protein
VKMLSVARMLPAKHVFYVRKLLRGKNRRIMCQALSLDISQDDMFYYVRIIDRPTVLCADVNADVRK